MIQMGGLSTFSPLAALKMRSFFKGAKGMMKIRSLRFEKMGFA